VTAYRAIDLQLVFLLAGSLALGRTLKETCPSTRSSSRLGSS